MTYNIPMQKPAHDSLYYPDARANKSILPTPALLVDLAALEFNINVMSDFFKHRSTRLRPHFKTHKCLTIAKKQVEAGAIGITCAKLSEAELLVNSGISSVLIANQIVDPAKIDRMAQLARKSQLIVAIDQLDNLFCIAKAAQKAASTIHVVIEVDVGLHRCGVKPGAPALSLAAAASQLQGIHFSGLLGYEGFTMFEPDPEKRQINVNQAMSALVASAELIRAADIPIEIVSAGGTGTYDLTGNYPGVTEVEAGSYVFMDVKYDQLRLPFHQALTLLATIISIPEPRRAIMDAGMKALTTDNGLPEIIYPHGVRLLRLNEEHGILEVDPDKVPAGIGGVVEIVPSHVCTTVNLHDRYYVIQGEHLVDIWEINGRGKSQ